ncbi:DUF4349 domain-containing protein [Sphingobacterium hungaricum]|nr:DUF4349 domain-containing protein [Sphingobacterium hungaricum]
MKKIFIAMAVASSLVFACQNAEKYDSSNASTEAILDSNSMDSIDEAKIIKTADMRFRVKDVQKTKEELSKSIREKGGTVAEFKIESNVYESQKVKLSSDSLKEINSYRTEGYLVAKIPAEKLDEFTNSIPKLAVFVNSASMKLDDQSLYYLSNKLKVENRVEAVETINKFATKKEPNVGTSLYIKDDYVDKKIENLSIDSQVKYSTITLNFYQDNTVQSFVVANDNLYNYKPSFGNRLLLSLENGWFIFKEIILALSNLWVLFLLAGAGFYIYRTYKVKRA